MHGWMRWVDGWMDGWIDDGWWNGLQKQGLKSLFCKACIFEIHLQPFHLTFDWVRTYSAVGWVAWTMGQTQTRTDKHVTEPPVLAAAQQHWSGGWVKGFAWWWNDGCPRAKVLMTGWNYKTCFHHLKEKASSCVTTNTYLGYHRAWTL